ncbi:MAG: DNA (cytosine-5-)-methyltransferase [Dehalococcoidia bacterium]|nr:DNA (cytosine-5-)-methyltransferase [Dehalococcoidia bacterium]
MRVSDPHFAGEAVPPLSPSPDYLPRSEQPRDTTPGGLRFVDLFAGLGGFHLALRALGHQCVFASEIDDVLRDVYKRNFGILPVGDIRKVATSDVPEHDILCAGFPCQPFSKAGAQDGFDDPEFGQLYRDIVRIIEHRKPRYVILENVPNFRNHNDGLTWSKIEGLLVDIGYDVKIGELSPHEFGIPQIRHRVYIVAARQSLDDFDWPKGGGVAGPISIEGILDRHPSEARPIPDHVLKCLSVWQEFLRALPRDEKVPHPLWSMEFGATYPFEERTPHSMATEELMRFSGSHGISLAGASTREELLAMLPSHARTRQDRFPRWKIGFIRLNREFYGRHRDWLDQWIPKIREFPSSRQKLEWNCQGETDRRISRYVVQLRASGVRVKRTTTAPSLIAMTSTQVPIITWERRYMTPAECKRLQSMEDLLFLPEAHTRAYEALGNAINVEVARRVAEAVLAVPDRSTCYRR